MLAEGLVFTLPAMAGLVAVVPALFTTFVRITLGLGAGFLISYSYLRKYSDESSLSLLGIKS